MVATRSTDRVAFVAGDEKVDPASITPIEWVAILQKAVKELPMGYLHGLKSLKSMLENHSMYGVKRLVDSPLPKLIAQISGKEEGEPVRPNAVFLVCAELGDDFPSSINRWEIWSKAPREPHELGIGKLLSIGRRYLLLARDAKFYQFSVTWCPKDSWDDRSMSSTPEDFWYQADPTSMAMKQLDELELQLLLTEFPSAGEVALYQFYMTLNETVSDMRGQYDPVFRRRETIAAYVDRIGRLMR